MGNKPSQSKKNIQEKQWERKNPLERNSVGLRAAQSEPRMLSSHPKSPSSSSTSFAARASTMLRQSAFASSSKHDNEEGGGRGSFFNGDDNGGGADLRSSIQQAGDILEGLDKSYIIPFRHLMLETPPIAAGGGGQIYRAEMHGAVVAVKALYSQLMTGEVEDLKHEVGMIARARCPNIISFYGVSHHQGVTYIVTEFCPLSLADVVGRAQFDGKAFSQVATQILQAIMYLHSNSIAHRDIKPPNVLLLADGCVKLCDLGMSKFVDQKKISLGAGGGIVGSPTYMPPEAFGTLKGDSGERAGRGGQSHEEEEEVKVDGKAWDIYSLGVLLWWMWHNQDPFYGNTNIFQVAELVKNGARPAWFKKSATTKKNIHLKTSGSSEISAHEENMEEEGEGKKEEEEEEEDCFTEAPKELIAFVNQLWAHDSFDRFQASDALRKFKSDVTPILLQMPSLRPNLDKLDEAPPLGVKYLKEIEEELDGGGIANKSKKSRKGVKFNFEEEEAGPSSTNSTPTSASSTTSTPTSGSDKLPSSPSASATKTATSSTLSPLSSLLITKANSQSSQEEKEESGGNSINSNNRQQPLLFQPPLPPPTPTGGMGGMIDRVDMVSAPDGELQQSVKKMMQSSTSDHQGYQSNDSLRSRLMLELVAAKPLLNGDGRDRGPSVIFLKDSDREGFENRNIHDVSVDGSVNKNNNMPRHSLTKCYGSNGSMDSEPASPNNLSTFHSNDSESSNFSNLSSSPQINFGSGPSSISSNVFNSPGSKSNHPKRVSSNSRGHLTGKFATMLQRQESLQLKEARILKGRTLRAESEALLEAYRNSQSDLTIGNNNTHTNAAQFDSFSSQIASTSPPVSPSKRLQVNSLTTMKEESSSASTSKYGENNQENSQKIRLSSSSMRNSQGNKRSSESGGGNNSMGAEALTEQEMRLWIFNMVGGELLSSVGSHLITDLKDGVVLCELLNTLLKRQLKLKKISTTEKELYNKAMIKTIHNSPLGFKQMENIATFIKSCRSLQLSKYNGNGSQDVLFDIGHLRSNQAGGLGKILNTLNILKNTFDPSPEMLAIIKDRESNRVSADMGYDVYTQQRSSKSNNSLSFSAHSLSSGGGSVHNNEASGGGSVQEGVFSVESPLAATQGHHQHHGSDQVPSYASSATTGGIGGSVSSDGDVAGNHSSDSNKAHLDKKTSNSTPNNTTLVSPLPPPPPPPSSSSSSSAVPPSPSTAELERRRLMDQFKNKAMSSSRTVQTPSPTSLDTSQLQVDSNAPAAAGGGGVNHLNLPPHIAARISNSNSTHGSLNRNSVEKKGNVKIIFRENS